MKVTVLFGLFLAGSSLPAWGQSGRTWMGETYDGGASLVYGTPDSDDVPIAFVCDLDSHDLRLVLTLGSDFEPRSGDAVAELRAPPNAESWSASGELAYYDEMDYVSFEGHGVFDATLSHMLKQGTSLSVSINGQSFNFSLDNAAAAIAPLEAVCAQPR